jgi:hypothetical protein
VEGSLVRVVAVVRGEEKRYRCEYEVFAELDSGERIGGGGKTFLAIGEFKKGFFRSRLLKQTREDVEFAVRGAFMDPSSFGRLTKALGEREVRVTDYELAELPFVVELDGGWLA